MNSHQPLQSQESRTQTSQNQTSGDSSSQPDAAGTARWAFFDLTLAHRDQFFADMYPSAGGLTADTREARYNRTKARFDVEFRKLLADSSFAPGEPRARTVTRLWADFSKDDASIVDKQPTSLIGHSCNLLDKALRGQFLLDDARTKRSTPSQDQLVSAWAAVRNAETRETICRAAASVEPPNGALRRSLALWDASENLRNSLHPDRTSGLSPEISSLKQRLEMPLSLLNEAHERSPVRSEKSKVDGERRGRPSASKKDGDEQNDLATGDTAPSLHATALDAYPKRPALTEGSEDRPSKLTRSQGSIDSEI